MTEKLLLGPGPSNTPPEVLAALARPTLGHLDPEFLALMDTVQEQLRQIFCTENVLTFPVSGTGSSGMETLLTNLLEPNDRVVVAINGVFGGRAADLAARLGANVVKVEHPWGQPVALDKIEAALKQAPTKALFFVHAETSTGALSDAAGLAGLAREHDALALMDCVTSLGGIDVCIDDWGIDAAFSGTQKCLSVPPGLAPVTLGKRAVAAIQRRRHPVQSWYLDLSMVEKYWGPERTYHHTAPINMIYGIHAGLKLALEEGLDSRIKRHRSTHRALVRGLAAMDLQLLPPEGVRLPMLNAVVLPKGLDDVALRSKLLHQHGIEVGAGLGELKGKVIRVGLMGHNSNLRSVVTFLAAFEHTLRQLGQPLAAGGATAAALDG